MYKKSVSEIGRSMVEMLGVLAIIGVLSVAGIAGYRYAMDRYIANDVLHESNIRGFDVTANFKGRRLPDIAEIGGYAKYTGTGKPIGVYPNPEDFSWSEYADKCPSEDLCQAFDVEVKGLNKRQCQMIMQSSWELPDAYLVSTGIAGDTSGDGTAPIASVSSSRPIMRTASNADSGLCDEFGEDEQNIAIRFRFVSTFTDFTDEDYESGWEDGITSDDEDGTGGGTGDGTGGTTGGGGTPTPEDPVVPETPTCTGNSYLSGTSCVECGTNQQVNSTSNGCECKQDYYPAGSCTTKCESPRSWLDGTCKCANGNWNGTSCVTCGTNEVWTGSDCVCDDSSYNSGDSCVQCPAKSTVNSGKNGCICTESNAYWNGTSCVSCGTNQQVNETQNGCECKTNWHGEGCTTYCDTSVASMSSGTCACKDTTTYWNGQACESCGANKVYENGSCVCNNQSYANGDSCIQCPSGSTPISGGCDCDGNGNWNGNSCITCDTNATFTDNVCKCNNGYYETGTSCTECKKPFQTFENNTVCRCPDGTHEEEGRCEPDDDGSGGVTNLCEAGWVWDSTLGECVSVGAQCQTAMTTAGFSTSNFTMDGTTIKYTGNMTVANDLDISGCDLNVAGELYISKGKTLKVKNVYGKSLSDSGINNHGGTIIANGNVRGISSQNFGIRNDEGIIKSQGIVIGTSSDEYGIRNDEGTIKAINVKGTSDINYGIVNEGSISASGDVLGIGNRSRAGIINTGSISKITATNVYYCKTIIDKGMIIGNIKCASGCTCTN